VKPFNTHEKRLFVQMYVCGYMASYDAVGSDDYARAVVLACSAWGNMIKAGLIQDHDDDQKEQPE
jgi:hypothetical protein